MRKIVCILLLVLCLSLSVVGCTTKPKNSHTATGTNIDTSGCIDPSIIQDITSTTATP